MMIINDNGVESVEFKVRMTGDKSSARIYIMLKQNEKMWVLNFFNTKFDFPD